MPGKEHQFIIAWFNSAGMLHIFFSAKGVAKIVREGASFEDSGILRIFKPTEERLVGDVTC